MLYRKLLKVTFADGSEIKPEPLEYMIYDGDHIILVNEENMSAKIIETEEQHFEINISHEKVKHPITDDEIDNLMDSWDFEQNLSSFEFDQIVENIYEYISNIHIGDDNDGGEYEIYKKFSIDSSDGGKFQIGFGADIIRRKIVPFIEIQDKSKKNKKTIFKTYLNKTNIKKIFNSLQSLKKILDKEFPSSSNQSSESKQSALS